MEACLLPVYHNVADLSSYVLAAVQASTHRLYLYFSEYRESAPSERLLSLLAELYDIVAIDNPCLDVIPLIPCAGWRLGELAKIEELHTVFLPKDYSGKCKELYEQIRGLRLANLRALSCKELRVHSIADIVECKETTRSRIEVKEPRENLLFKQVAVGGTFDRLHAGHRLLLAITALVASHSAYIGVTSNQLLVDKKFKELLQSLDDRKTTAVEFMQHVRPDLEIIAGSLLDPKERTSAAADPEMEALVVSQETVQGGEQINEDRSTQGFKRLTLVIVNLLGVGSKALGGQKLSSTALREKEAMLQRHSEQK